VLNPFALVLSFVLAAGMLPGKVSGETYDFVVNASTHQQLRPQVALATPAGRRELETCQSPSYGYTIADDPATWDLVDESSQDDGDILHLRSERSQVIFTGFQGTAVSATKGNR
jgi:hypothetical protein